MNREDIRKIYAELKYKNEQILSTLKRRQLFISLLRLLVFISGGILSIITFSYTVMGGILILLTAIVLFLILLKRFTGISNEITITESLITINNNEINALDGDYSAFDGGPEWIDPGHDFSGDIDLFGDDSLFRFLNRTVTGPGKSLLAKWLSDPYNLRNEIQERQDAVIELAAKLTWRQQFIAFGFDKPLDNKEIKSLSDWLNEAGSLFSSRFMKTFAFILPLAGIISLLAFVAGFISFMVFLLVFIFNLFVTGIFIKKSNRIHSLVSQKQIFLTSVGKLVKSFEKEQFVSPVLLNIKKKIITDQGSVAEKIRELNNIIKAFDSRLNMFAGFILNGLLLWDVQCIMRLEKWRASAVSSLPVLLNLLGEVDGLNSIANYAYNNPDHTFPQINNRDPVIEAFGIGHPLLKKEIRVNNDFSIQNRGQVFIITGANMAGKSTFLRTLAVNMVLAMTGAPVCAAGMSFSPVKLFTSMRTTDSLSQNESYFYAELKRLKALKERLEVEENVLFILDEILKGTNSTDKSIGSKLILKRLIELRGTGLIATHDTSLGEMEHDYPEHVVNKCFEIEIDGEIVSFDYILRNGITRKMNAAVLMKQMGIV